MKAMMEPINAMTDVVIRLEERAGDRADKHFLMFNDQRTSYMLNALNFTIHGVELLYQQRQQ